MKLKIVPLFFIYLAINSCTKHSNRTEGSDGEWTIEDTSYNITSSARMNSNGYFIFTGLDAESPADTLQIFFASVPLNSGNYNVVHFQDDVALGANEIGIRIHIPHIAGVYASTGIANNITWLPADPASVTVTNEKLKVEIPSMTLIRHYVGVDSSRFQGVISEANP